jgi:hypothetical protein
MMGFAALYPSCFIVRQTTTLSRFAARVMPV